MFSKTISYLSFSQLLNKSGHSEPSPFCKGGLRGIYLIQDGLIEKSFFFPLYIFTSVGYV